MIREGRGKNLRVETYENERWGEGKRDFFVTLYLGALWGGKEEEKKCGEK